MRGKGACKGSWAPLSSLLSTVLGRVRLFEHAQQGPGVLTFSPEQQVGWGGGPRPEDKHWGVLGSQQGEGTREKHLACDVAGLRDPCPVPDFRFGVRP